MTTFRAFATVLCVDAVGYEPLAGSIADLQTLILLLQDDLQHFTRTQRVLYESADSVAFKVLLGCNG